MDSIEPAARSEHILVDDTGASLGGCGGSIAILSCVGLVLAISAGSLFWIVVLGIIAVVSLAVLALAMLELQRWEPLELHFAEWPLQIGSSTPVRAIRRAKQSVPDAQFTLEAELECKESATYTVGTDTRTDTDVVHEHEVEVTGHLQDRVFEAHFTIDIPHNRGAPSMDLGNNKVEWKLDIDIDELSRMMAKVAFTLEVAPTLDLRHRDIQDTVTGDS